MGGNNAQDLKATLDGGVGTILNAAKHIEERLKVLEEKEKHWQEIKVEMQRNKEAAKSKMALDVGGKRFATSKETLLRFKGSYFCNQLASGWQPDEDGSYFIDRDPKHFAVILNYMRNGGELQLSSELEKEFDYYKVKVEPAHLVPPPPLPLPPVDIFFANNSKQAEMLQQHVCNKGTLLEAGKHTWTVRLDNVVPACDVGVVAPVHISHFNMSTPTAWGIRDNGCAFHTPATPVSTKFKTGDIIKLELDLGARTLQYTINGVKVNFVHTDVVSPVHVAFCGNTGCKATIID